MMKHCSIQSFGKKKHLCEYARVCFNFIKTNYKIVIQYLIISFTILFVDNVNKYKKSSL